MLAASCRSVRSCLWVKRNPCILPREILLHILSFLDVYSLMSFSKTCKGNQFATDILERVMQGSVAQASTSICSIIFDVHGRVTNGTMTMSDDLKAVCAVFIQALNTFFQWKYSLHWYRHRILYSTIVLASCLLEVVCSHVQAGARIGFRLTPSLRRKMRDHEESLCFSSEW